SVLVILSALALFAVTVTPVFDVSGEVGFELLLDESALDINSLVDIDLTVEIPFSTTSGNLSIGLKLNPEVTVGEPVNWTTPATHTHTAEFSYKDILDFVQYEEEAWLLRYEPKAIKLSDYTVNQFTDAKGALKFGLKKYNLSLELADLKGNEVDKHATGTLAFPEGWIFGAKYDLGISEEIEGFVATAFKLEDKGNNRFSIEGNLSKSPLPGEEKVDLVFALLNEKDTGESTASTATNAYRVYVSYAYPVTVDGITLKPHASFKAQEGLKTVFAPEVTKDTDKKIDWPDAREIGAGFDVEANPEPFKVGVKDTFKFKFLDMDDPSFALSLNPYFEYAVTDFTLGVDVPMNFDFKDPLVYKIVPNLYAVLGIDNLKVAGDVYYFLKDAPNQPVNKFAYTADVTYTYNILQTGFHLGNETRDANDKVNGANELTDLHGYLFLKASIEF
ncbi:MAG TPA: hypothetical protein PK723_05345, partial [Candidatus Pacearchaeota archaeon]|nr:hypothetical protein [Candidatus Pacearchaeota archaeon]